MLSLPRLGERAHVLGTAIAVSTLLIQRGANDLALGILAVSLTAIAAEERGHGDASLYRRGAERGLLISSLAFALPLSLIATTRPAALPLARASVLIALTARLSIGPRLGGLLSLLALALGVEHAWTSRIALLGCAVFAAARTLLERTGLSRSFSAGEAESVCTLAAFPVTRTILGATEGLRLRLRLDGRRAAKAQAQAQAQASPGACIAEAALTATFLGLLTAWPSLRRSRRAREAFAAASGAEGVARSRTLRALVRESTAAWLALGSSMAAFGYGLAALHGRVEPLAWAADTFVLNPSPERTAPALIVAFWLLSLLAGVGLSPEPMRDRGGFRICCWLVVTKIVARKWYHFLAVLMFSPALCLNPVFTAMAFVGALIAFATAEAVRLGGLYPVSDPLDAFMSRYLDERESGPLIVSHSYLLLGCALPLLLTLTFAGDGFDHPASVLASSGIISLGIGDSFASIVGSTLGKRFLGRVPGTKKSYEGMLAAFVSMALATAILAKAATLATTHATPTRSQICTFAEFP